MTFQNFFKTTTGVLLLTATLAAPCAKAGITGSIEVHNSRSEDITVTIERANGTSTDYIVGARSYRSIFVGDNADGTTWLYAYDSSGEIKRDSAGGNYSSYTWWVD